MADNAKFTRRCEKSVYRDTHCGATVNWSIIINIMRWRYKIITLFIWLNEGMRERWRLTMKKISTQHTHIYTKRSRIVKKKKLLVLLAYQREKKMRQKKVFTRKEKYAVSKKKFRTLERGVYFVEGPCWRIKLKTSSSKKGQPPHQPIQPPYPESGIKSNQKKIKKKSIQRWRSSQLSMERGASSSKYNRMI